LEQLRSHANFAQGLVLSTLPRGGLQVAQPLNVSEGIVKAYTDGLHAQDRLTWQAIVRNEPVRASDAFANDEQSAYVQKVMQPLGVKYALALPLAGPVLEGYPGAVHFFRTADQGDFTAEDVRALQRGVQIFEVDLGQVRLARRGDEDAGAALARPPVSITVVDNNLNAHTPANAWNRVDGALRNNIVEQAKRQFASLNGTEVHLDRINLPDSHGDQWVFNRVVYKSYPALSDGPVTFFCLQPDCADWSSVKATDLQADPEVSRLMPAVRFMHAEYSRGPTLAEIAQQVKLSPFHFHRRFTELLGMTPKQYMLACQVHQAKTELLAGRKSLAQIAKDCGFAHQSHFTSRFKQAAGLTPTRWRRMALRRTGQTATESAN
jgi:AraC-like DNA-binding protein